MHIGHRLSRLVFISSMALVVSATVAAPATPASVAVANPTGHPVATAAGGIPGISLIAPDSGSRGGGTMVAIYGSNFVPDGTKVFFGSVAVAATCSPTLCRAIAPAGKGTVPVRATTAGGTSAATASFTYLAPLPMPCLVLSESSVVSTDGPWLGVMAVADFNEDGADDVAFPDMTLSSLAVLLGSAAGGFGPPTVYPAGTVNALIPFAADFDGDGHVDVILADDLYDLTAGTETTELWMLRGTGSGSFGPGQKVASFAGALGYFPLTGDFNGDGRLDIAFDDGHAIQILLQTDGGTFVAHPLPGNYGPVAVSDFNRDGITDLATLTIVPGEEPDDATPKELVILLGTGSGDFTPTRFPTAVKTPIQLSAGDFNADGLPDLVASDFSGGVTIFLAKDDGTFATRHLEDFREYPLVVVADWNGDGFDDLVVESAFPSYTVITFFLGRGDGTFVASSWAWPAFPIWMLKADVDGDGRIDLVGDEPEDAGPPKIFRNTTVTGSLAFSSATYAAGENAGSVTATVNRTDGSDCAVSVAYATAPGTAKSGLDYSTQSGTVTFAAGDTAKPIFIPITVDTIAEGDETFTIALTNPVGATLGSPSSTTVTISDSNAAPTMTLGISGATMAEAGGIATVTATLSWPSVLDVTVALGFSGTATAGTDYTVSASSIVILAGNTIGTATIAAVQDAIDEPDETIVVDIATVTNATESGAQQVTATIRDDDPAPSIAIGSVSRAEGSEGGTTEFAFPVTLSGPSAQTITVSYATVAGTATAPDDFVSATGVVTFAPGITAQTIVVNVVADAIWENDDVFTVVLSNAANAVIGTSTATGTILNDDAPTGYPWIRSVTPAAGRTGGGTSVAISGAGFAAGASVTFAGLAATNVSVASTSLITATAPPHPLGTADLIVRNPNGEAGILPRAYTYAAAGDANADGQVSTADIFFLVHGLFANGPAPCDCADVHGDGGVNVSEIFYLINYLFGGGPPPQ